MKVTVTTSWDDGHVLDLKVARLLRKYNLAGTFYLSPESREIEPTKRLSAKQIKTLSNHFEIGAHTSLHPDLSKVSTKDAVYDITKGKDFLEKTINKKITSFCYPYGQFNEKNYRAVKSLGFNYARTVKQFCFDIDDPLIASTTIHAYFHWSNLAKIIRFARYNPTKFVRYLDWSKLAMAQFDQCKKTGGDFHLWGHSWEIDQRNDWHRLEKVFSYIANHKDVKYVPNSDLGRKVKQKLLMATPYFPPKVGGLERYAFEIAKRALGDGYDVTVITSGNSRDTELETNNGLRIYRLPVQFKFANTPLSIKWYQMIKKILQKEKPDIINAHAPVPGLPDLVCLAAKNTPIAITYHSGSMKKGGLFLDSFILMYERFFLPIVLKRANQIICSSDSVRNFLGEYQHKSVTINPGVNTEIFFKRKAVPNNRSVLFVGNFNNNWKGLRYLEEAMKLIPDATLNVVGKGKRADLPNVVYRGELQDKDLVAQLHKASVLVLPSTSNSESFGMVLIEAMACGVPVIGSNIGGIPTVIKNKIDGLLVTPKNTLALAKAISYILDNKKEANKLAQNAHQKVVKYFSWDKLTEKYLEIISDMIEFKKISNLKVAKELNKHLKKDSLPSNVRWSSW